MNLLLRIIRTNLLTLLAIGIVLLIVPSSIVYAQYYGPGDERNSDCGGSIASCGGDDGSSSTNVGSACSSAANSCGVRNYATIQSNGQCGYLVQTGTDGKGNPTYTIVAVTVPANPANYGSTCSSAANACGVRNTGTIGCSGTCSATTPSLPAGYGTSCQSAANACGVRTSGTIQCNGTCSVSTAPANPANYGVACSSPTNACGVSNTGTIQCNGQCSVSTTVAPALPAGYGNSCQSAANSCGMTNSGIIQCSGSCSAAAPAEILCSPDATQTLQATPRLVQPNASSRITWSSTNAASCTVVGNGDSWTGTSGQQQLTSPITETVTYVMTCIGLNARTVITSVIIDIVPAWKEL